MKNQIKKEALNFLKAKNIMVVSSISENLEPASATLYYAADDSFNLYFATSKKSRKAQNLKTNGKVAFVVGFGPEIITIQGGGEAKILPDKDAEIFYELIKKSALRTAYEWPIVNFADEGFYIFKITPSWLCYLNMDKENYPDIASEKYYKII